MSDPTTAGKKNRPRGPGAVVGLVALAALGFCMLVVALGTGAAPTVVVTSPASAESWTVVSPFDFRATISPPNSTATLNSIPLAVNATGGVEVNVSLVEGPNEITVIATDWTNETASETRIIYLDTAPPTLAFQSPSDNATITNKPVSSVRGNISEPGSVSLNGIPLVVNASLEFSYDYTLSDGLNVLRFVADDRAGNEEVVVRTIEFDRYAPYLQVDSPANGSLTNQVSIDVSGRSEPSAQVAVNTIAASVNPVDGTFTVLGVPLDDQADPTVNLIVIKATDRAGNIRYENRTVLVDDIPPVITLTLDASLRDRIAGRLPVNLTTMTISGIIDTPSGTVTVGGQPVMLNGSAFSPKVSLFEGVNIVVVAARDPAGNVAEVTLIVTRDTIPPAVRLTKPSNPSVFTQSLTLLIQGAVGEEYAPVHLRYTGAAGEILEGLPLSQPLPPDGWLHFEATLDLAGDSLPHTVSVEAVDVAGNLGVASFTYVSDRVPPLLENLTVERLGYGQQVWVNGSTELGIDSVMVNGLSKPVVDGRFAVLLNFPVLPPGEYWIRLVLQDAAGNERRQNLTTAVDLPYTLFEIEVNGMPWRAPAAGEAVELSLRGSEALPSDAGVRWFMDGQPVGEGRSLPNFVVPEGNHNISVRASNSTWGTSVSHTFDAASPVGLGEGFAPLVLVAAGASAGLAVGVVVLRRRRQ